MMGAMIDLDHPEIGFTVGALKEAAQLAQKIQREMAPTALTKEDKSPVTVADFAVQALMGRSLEMAFPEDSLVGRRGFRNAPRYPTARHSEPGGGIRRPQRA